MRQFGSVVAGAFASLLLLLSPLSVAQAETTATKAKAAPLMWVMKDGDSTVYILGSIHLMKPGTHWRTPAIAEAFAASDELWLELNDADDVAKMQGLIMKYGLDLSGGALTDLTPEDVAQLDLALKPLGLSSAHVVNMKKWLVSIILVQAQAQRLGYDALTGVDMVLLKEARDRGIPVHAFETSEQQVLILAGGTPEEDLLNLRYALADVSQEDNALDRLFGAWLIGDAVAIDREMNAYTNEVPDMYRRLIYDRNAAWIPQIEQIMAGEGTVFIAVGAGHLVGKDSVIEMLRARGYTVTQVQP